MKVSAEADGPIIGGKPSTIGLVFRNEQLSHVIVLAQFTPDEAAIITSTQALATWGKAPDACPVKVTTPNNPLVECTWEIGTLAYSIIGYGPLNDFNLRLEITSTQDMPTPPPIARIPLPPSTGPTRPTAAAAGWTRRTETDPYSQVKSVTWQARLAPITRDAIGSGAPLLVLRCTGEEPAVSLHFTELSPPPLFDNVYIFGTRIGPHDPIEFNFEYASYGWLDMTWESNENWAGDLFYDALTLSHPIFASLTNGFSGAVTRYRTNALPLLALRDLTPCTPTGSIE